MIVAACLLGTAYASYAQPGDAIEVQNSITLSWQPAEIVQRTGPDKYLIRFPNDDLTERRIKYLRFPYTESSYSPNVRTRDPRTRGSQRPKRQAVPNMQRLSSSPIRPARSQTKNPFPKQLEKLERKIEVITNLQKHTTEVRTLRKNFDKVCRSCRNSEPNATAALEKVTTEVTQFAKRLVISLHEKHQALWVQIENKELEMEQVKSKKSGVSGVTYHGIPERRDCDPRQDRVSRYTAECEALDRRVGELGRKIRSLQAERCELLLDVPYLKKLARDVPYLQAMLS